MLSLRCIRTIINHTIATITALPPNRMLRAINPDRPAIGQGSATWLSLNSRKCPLMLAEIDRRPLRTTISPGAMTPARFGGPLLMTAHDSDSI